jgi:indolepyruvate ferredoxin oxidoreductase, beta subunit
MMSFDIVTCGVGGQGLMLISNVLGLACTEVGLNIKTAETHGLAQRSGSIYTHIRIGEKLYSSLIPYGEANVLLGMEAIETLRNIEFLEENGIIILNDYIWYPVQSTFERVQDDTCSYITLNQIMEQLKKITSRIHLVNALDLANQAGNPVTSNMVLLGALVKINKFPIPFGELESIIPQVVPEKAVEANLKALKRGYQAI